MLLISFGGPDKFLQYPVPDHGIIHLTFIPIYRYLGSSPRRPGSSPRRRDGRPRSPGSPFRHPICPCRRPGRSPDSGQAAPLATSRRTRSRSTSPTLTPPLPTEKSPRHPGGHLRHSPGKSFIYRLIFAHQKRQKSELKLITCRPSAENRGNAPPNPFKVDFASFDPSLSHGGAPEREAVQIARSGDNEIPNGNSGDFFGPFQSVNLGEGFDPAPDADLPVT